MGEMPWLLGSKLVWLLERPRSWEVSTQYFDGLGFLTNGLVKGLHDLNCLGHESIVEIDHTYKLLQNLDGGGLWQVNYSLYFAG